MISKAESGKLKAEMVRALRAAAFLISAFCFQFSAFSSDPVRPDPKLTPGDWLKDVTVEQITQRGYANKLNGGARHVTTAEKRQVFINYFGSVPACPGNYEIDHLISLELGGSNDIKNLWPQSYLTTPWNSRVKDRLEDWMAARVRHSLASAGHGAATALLAQYQREIASDWIAAYQKYLGSLPAK